MCQDHKLTCRLEAGLGEEENSHCLLLALLLSYGKGLKPAFGVCRSCLGQGSPGSKPEQLFVVVRMRALAYLRTTTSLCCSGLTLTCRAGRQCTPPSRSRCSSGRDGGLAAVCQRLRCSGHSLCGLPDSLWSSGHSLWSLARWTQPLDLSCGAMLKWTPPVGSGPRLTEGDIRVLWGLRSGTLPVAPVRCHTSLQPLLTLL